jgi:hypothetical protein
MPAFQTTTTTPTPLPNAQKTKQYSDTIYRPTSFNGYTSDPPSSQQSIQYLYRNEVLTNLEELRDELTYVLCCVVLYVLYCIVLY